MHEFGVCRDIVEAVIDELEKLGPPKPVLRSARIAVGAMHQIVQDTLGFAYESMVKGLNILEPGTPVSFEVLCNEIKGLGLNIELQKKVTI